MSFGKAADAVQRPEGIETVATTGQQLVCVRLMSHIPDNLVRWRGEHLVQSDCQLDNAERGRQMTAIGRTGFDDDPPQVSGKLGKPGSRKPLDICG